MEVCGLCAKFLMKGFYYAAEAASRPCPNKACGLHMDPATLPTMRGGVSLYPSEYQECALQKGHYTENSKQIYPEMKLRGLVPNSDIHVSVRDLFIPTIGLAILLQENRRTDRGNI
jgi:hypothetical protein